MRRAAAVAVVAAVALTGCSSAKDDRRNAVNRYLASVNEVEQQAATPLARARKAYTGLGRGAVSERQLRELAAAPRTIRSLRTRIARVAPPEDARRLHASLLRLLDLNASFAEEVESFARYVRAVGPLEQRLGAETAQLRRALRRSSVGGQEQRTLTRYAAQLDELVVRFRRLRPPPALAPWHAGQVARVGRLRRGARELTSGLARRDRKLTQSGLTALTRAAATSSVTAADRAAILAYNARLKRIRAAGAAVAREQARLTRELT
jgi:hypothetical protein